MPKRPSLRTPDGRFTKERPPPPPAEHRNPSCSVCGKETYWDDDEFICDGCKAAWDASNLESSRWFEDEEPACLAQIKYWDTPDLKPEHENIRHVVESCTLIADGHEMHLGKDGFPKWTDDDPRVIRKGNR